MKSLQSNPDLYVIAYKKNKKRQNKQSESQCLYYREIAVNKFEGPYCYPKSHEYRIDVTYQDHPEIYSEYLKSVLSVRNLFKLHEYLLENHTKFGIKFKKYWQSICNPVLIPTLINNGSIIFVSGKYLFISWIASKQELYAFPGYESKVPICGGKQIDVKIKYNSFIAYRNIKYKNDTMWYVDYGEQYEIVSESTSNFCRISDIRDHKEMYKIRKILHVGLKTIPGKLKLYGYGEDFTWKYKFVDFIWEEYLENMLQQCNIVPDGTYMKKWNLLLGEANVIFDLFEKQTYFERYYENGESTYLSNMMMQFSTKTGYLSIEAVQLKRNRHGDVYGLKKLDDDEMDIYSIFTCLSLEIQYNIMDYLSKTDWKIMENISEALNKIVASKSKQDTFATFRSKLYNHKNK